MIYIKSFFLMLLVAFPAAAQSTLWKFDNSHSSVQFSVTHLVISDVSGNFKVFDGEVKTDGDDFTKSNISFTIDVNSINTGNEKRDNHLKSDDFFNAEKFPKITFAGKSLKKTGNNKYKLTGDFTIRDVTKQVELDVTQTGPIMAWGEEKTGFKIKGTINRFDYNLKWNTLLEAGGAVVGEDVEILCNVQLVKQAG
ncbi:MAG: YceI family protein [Ignavibacteriaceae bacterium]